MEPVIWRDGRVELLDQRLLPQRVQWVHCRDYRETARGIRDMVVRGAPAIGVTAAYGLAQAVRASRASDRVSLLADLHAADAVLRAARPTAVTLMWALDRMLAVAQRSLDIVSELEKEALAIHQETRELDQRIAQAGLAVVPPGTRILTHCHTGGLATGGTGTALGVIMAAHRSGYGISVWVDETRPYLQGSRITAWELQQAGVPATLICDNMAGYFMGRGEVDLVLVGTDRMAANGDFANKIGTYSLAVLAHAHRIPFYPALPLSSIDLAMSDGRHIPIEQRSPQEVTHFRGMPVAPAGVQVANPAFDMTPHSYVTGIITEAGVLRPPFTRTIAQALGK
ncbi:MAG: S-methyl-5-thioribose-1-phosphate isomerase [Deinococcus sp.]|nr:S-methyl-5-thioribose-1-phosphate isomerase [Deinococcus sp.]